MADLDGDGLEDVLTLDREGNRVVVMRQRRSTGLDRGEAFGTFRDPKAIDAGLWSESGSPGVFVLSEEEDVVGVSSYEDGRLTFPAPIALETAGGTPVAMARFDWDGAPALAVVVKLKRDYHLELHEPGGRVGGVIELDGVRREPGSILAADVDNDGSLELLLLTPGEPMLMVRCAGSEDGLEPREALAKEEMPQFGLVQNAGPGNTAMLDVDGDGREELVLCESNFVRACSFDEDRGWRVIEQLNVPWEGAKLSTLGVVARSGAPTVIVGDSDADLLGVVRFGSGGRPELADRMRVPGLTLSRLAPGSHFGDARASVLGVADEGLAIIRLEGEGWALEPFAVYRPEAEDRYEHDLEAGDVNGDGLTDVVVLDAGEAMCSILTFSEARKLHLATEWAVFESNLFTGGQSREFEPSAAIVGELTGDSGADLLLVVHDRVIVHPQSLPEAGDQESP